MPTLSEACTSASGRRLLRRVAVLATTTMMVGACAAGGTVIARQGGASGSAAGVGAAVTGEISVGGCRPELALIPSNTTETCGSAILDAVTARLVRYDNADARAVNDLAASIVTKNATKYTIKLKRGITFSDGTPLRAANFVRAWNFAAYGPNRQASGYLLEPIAGYRKVAAARSKVTKLSGLKVVDPYTFTVTLSAPSSTFGQRLGLLAYAPLPDSFFTDRGKKFGKLPIGAGPYRLVSADPASAFVLEQNTGYTRTPKAAVGRITVKVYDDPALAYEDLVAGRIDLLDVAPPAAQVSAAQYENDLGGRTVRRTLGVMQTLTFPSAKADASYRNPKLRRAISMAIDRDSIIRTVFNGARARATGWVPPGISGYTPKGCGSTCSFNPALARKLYKAAGGHTGPIRIGYNADADHQAWVVAACKSIKATLGVACRPKPSPDFATFRGAIVERKATGLFQSGWLLDYPSIENFLVPLYARGGESNDNDYRNKKFEARLAAAAAQPNLAKANALFQQAERLLRADLPSIPLWSPVAVAGHSSRIRSATLTAFGTYDLTSVVLA